MICLIVIDRGIDNMKMLEMFALWLSSVRERQADGAELPEQTIFGLPSQDIKGKAKMKAKITHSHKINKIKIMGK